MGSASLGFIAFGLCTVLLSNISRKQGWRRAVLMISTCVFLWLLAPQVRLFVPIFGFLALGYLCILTQRTGLPKSLRWCVLSIVMVYVWLKQYTGLPSQLFLRQPYFTLGLSYIIFRVLHLVTEASVQKSKSRHISVGAYLLFILNFTTFVSGPLQRYDEFAACMFTDDPLPLDRRIIGSQIERIVRGFFKVNVLGMLFHAVQTDAFNQLRLPLSGLSHIVDVFLVSVTFPLFLYANFSGYIDIVIALARLLRIKLPENFDRPFSATSFLDFWSRWHISLSVWLKTYVYNPLLLSMMRRVPARSAEPLLGASAFFITFFLIGIWHGRTSEFLMFGLLQGGGVAVNKLWQVVLTRQMGRKRYQTLATSPLYAALARGLTFSWFAFTLFWFWGTWMQVRLVLGAAPMLIVWASVWLTATTVLALWEDLRAIMLAIKTEDGPLLIHRYAMVVYASLLGLVSLAVVALNQPAPDLVYKAF